METSAKQETRCLMTIINDKTKTAGVFFSNVLLYILSPLKTWKKKKKKKKHHYRWETNMLIFILLPDKQLCEQSSVKHF